MQDDCYEDCIRFVMHDESVFDIETQGLPQKCGEVSPWKSSQPEGLSSSPPRFIKQSEGQALREDSAGLSTGNFEHPIFNSLHSGQYLISYLTEN